MSFHQAVASVHDTLAGVAGVAIVYARGDETVAIANAVVGRTTMQLNDQSSGFVVKTDVRDYLIPAASLVLDDELVEPAEGDTITEISGGMTRIYEVMRPDNGEPAWRYSDAMRTRVRVHVKLVSEEATGDVEGPEEPIEEPEEPDTGPGPEVEDEP